MTKYAILLGYGLFDQKNANYRKYLDAFSSFARKNKIENVIICGGRTSPQHPYDSEAGTMQGYLAGKLGKAKIEIENRSMTTAQNIRFARRFIVLRKGDRAFIFCDNIRPFKVLWYVMHYWYGLRKGQIEDHFVNLSIPYYKKRFTTEQMGKVYSDNLTYGNVTVNTFKMRKEIEDAIGQIPASVLEISSIYDKGLERKLMHAIRVKFGFEK